MLATVRRYGGVDESRTSGLKQRVGETVITRLSTLPGFGRHRELSVTWTTVRSEGPRLRAFALPPVILSRSPSHSLQGRTPLVFPDPQRGRSPGVALRARQ